jgi:hypothetical protein
MRFVGTVIAAAVLLVLLYLFVAFILQGYFGVTMVPENWIPDTWSAPDSLGQWRDIVIILLGIFWILSGILMVALLVALLFLVFLVRRILKQNAAPALDSLKDSLDNIRGTAEFAGESVVSPIIRVYSVISGVRSGIGAVSHLPGRIKGRKK